ncbi:MAG: D-2-hydroxyacid dehydrogenase [Clostridia bacterium]|nr:D-2-hydroxyacid dehydrogenase [Clostridia bacterium]
MKMLITEAQVLSNGDISFKDFEKYGELTVEQNLSYDELKNVIHNYDALFCNKLNIDKPLLDAAKNLKYIGECATGYNNIDINECKRRGITVCNAGSYSTNAVAQQTFAYILNHFSKVSFYDAFVKNNGWINSPVFSPVVTCTDELAGKTLGIVGYGSIGRAVERIAKAFLMNVIVYTRTIYDESEADFVSLDELLSRSDIVSLHLPLTNDNAGMFCKETFSKMKDGAYFINTARGGLVNEPDLAEALISGKLSGAAVDVLTKEPMDKNCVLKTAPNITITPHSAWVPYSTRKRLIGIILENLDGFINGTPKNKIV